MKLVANIQLRPTPEQNKLLTATLAASNMACNYIHKQASNAGITGQYAMHKLVYYDVRKRFALTAQVTVRCIAKVADAYKSAAVRGQPVQSFSAYAAQPYDQRIFRFRDDTTISIWTTGGRQTIPYVCGARQRALLVYRRGEVDLMLIKQRWYIAIVCDVPEPAEIKAQDVLGVDLGAVNLAYDSDGRAYSGKGVEDARWKFSHRRRNLQRKGTRSAHRKLQSISGRQARFQRDMNHCISKQVVDTAQRSCRAIALENLQGIRDRVQARRRQRARLANWSFAQLRTFLTYKAKLSGVPLVLVDPRNTSRTCPKCGHCEKNNRPDRGTFLCRSCGNAGPSDYIAALNIRARAVVNQPMVVGVVTHVASPGYKPSASAGGS